MNNTMKADVRALGTASHIGREVSVDEAFGDTFDQAVTCPAIPEPFDCWAEWFGVEVYKPRTEKDMIMGIMALSPFVSDEDYIAALNAK